MITNPDNVLKSPPKDNPTIAIRIKYDKTCRFSVGGNLNKKKHTNNAIINGTIRTPLLMIFLKR
jgi:hypothetical protein